MMFLQIARTHFMKFRRDRTAFVMTFIVPIAFFSSFALMYGGRGGSSTSRIRVAVIDQAQSAQSRTLVERIRGEKSLTMLDGMSAATAESAIRKGDLSLAILLPPDFSSAGRKPKVVLLADTSDPFSSRIVATTLQKLTLGKFPIDVQTRDVLGETKKRNPRVAFAAAGLGVMFLLFVASASGGALIDEAENGTLDRILSSRVSMTQLLLGKVAYLVALSTVQLTITFTWAAFVFGVELAEHFAGFLLMTVATAIATASFGLMLATLCRSRAQLSALSTLVVLTMSAVGGSLFPRFLMPDGMKKLGLLTINGWALEGFLKVFWREEALLSLWPQLTVLLLAGLTFFTTARTMARRWEAQ
ncbi:MAG TPA: ABC transporter permease [Thermoanaerobaculia bacterium]